MPSDRSNVRRLPINNRKYERVRITEFLRIYCVDSETMSQVELLDVSEEGCAFRFKQFAESTDAIPAELQMRFYFSPNTFLSLTFRVMNSRLHVEEGKRFMILGCSVDKNSESYDVYLKFVEFLEVYVERAECDVGDVSISYL